jgi:hypothetical protein
LNGKFIRNKKKSGILSYPILILELTLSEKCIQVTTELQCNRDFNAKVFIPITLQQHHFIEEPIDRNQAINKFLLILGQKWRMFLRPPEKLSIEYIRQRNSLLACSCFPGIYFLDFSICLFCRRWESVLFRFPLKLNKAI